MLTPLLLAVIWVLLVNAILADSPIPPPLWNPVEHPQKLSIVFAVFTAVIVAVAVPALGAEIVPL